MSFILLTTDVAFRLLVQALARVLRIAIRNAGSSGSGVGTSWTAGGIGCGCHWMCIDFAQRSYQES